MKTVFLILSLFFALVTQAQETIQEGQRDLGGERIEAIRGTSNYLRVREGEKWSVINKNGKKITAIKYDYVNSFSEGFMWVAAKGKYGAIDTMGNEITPIKYEACFDFENGFAAVKIGKRYGYINTEGKEITPIKYESFYSFNQGYCSVRLNGKYGIIDAHGKVIVPIAYDMSDIHSIGVLYVYLNKKKIYFTKHGKELPALSKYQEIGPLSNGLAWVKVNDKYGYINKELEEVIPPQFELCWNFDDKGVAGVKRDGVSFHINKKGEAVR